VAPDILTRFHPAVRDWFAASFPGPTRAQAEGWPAIARGESTLILAPTGSGKTLAAFLWCINRLMFEALPRPSERCRVVYVSPLKALAVDVERNLRAPIAGIANMAGFRGTHYELPAVAVRTGDTPPRERARFRREPADILITTPESLYLLLTSGSRETLRSIDTVIVDEIHALVPTKRGATWHSRSSGWRRSCARRSSASASRPRNDRSTKSRASSAASRDGSPRRRQPCRRTTRRERWRASRFTTSSATTTRHPSTGP
jgi:Lhr-like helicase